MKIDHQVLTIILALWMLFHHTCSAHGAEPTVRIVTAYNVGDVHQTDDEPCIDASNTNICTALDRGERRCAANFVPLGTTIWIESYGACKVTDRTHRRYSDRVDIAMKFHEKQKALNWGARKLKVEVLQ